MGDITSCDANKWLWFLNFGLGKSHVLPALIRKFYLGKCLVHDDLKPIKASLNKGPINGVDGLSVQADIFLPFFANTASDSELITALLLEYSELEKHPAK